MRERPILFSAPMVRAILAGQKTQTRRIVKPQPGDDIVRFEFEPESGLWLGDNAEDIKMGYCSSWAQRCPYGQPGDRLIVKEAAWVWCQKERDGETKTGRPKFNYIPKGRFVHYQADEQKPTYRVNESPAQGWRLKIGRYLRRWASRITLEVTDVRVERLQSISTMDAMAEGIPQTGSEAHALGLHDMAKEYGHEWDNRTSVENFKRLWSMINGAESWAANPWVWVVTFKPVLNAESA